MFSYIFSNSNALRAFFYIPLLSSATGLAAANAVTDTIDSKKSLQEVQVKGHFKQGLRSALPAQTLNASQIANLNASNVADVAKHFAGVTVKDYGGIGGLKTVSVRGLGAAHTGVCYDGMMMNNVQTGQIDLSQFSIENAHEVSLFNGHPSDLLQPAKMFASASVLSFNTKIPNYDSVHIIQGDGRIKVGSFGLLNPSILLTKNFSKSWAVSLSANALVADGKYPFWENINSTGKNLIQKKRINTDVHSLRTEQNLLYRISKYQNISLKSNQYYCERGLPGADILYSNTATERLLDKNTFNQIRYENKTSCYFQYQLAGKYSNQFTEFNERSPNYSSLANNKRIDNFTQKEYYLTTALQSKPNDYFTFSSSLDWSNNSLQSNSNINFIKESSPVRNTGLINFAGKYNNNRLTIATNLLYIICHETTETGAPTPDKNKWMPTASICYKIFSDKDLRIRAFFKNIFVLPTFTDLYYHDFGFKSLRPENTNQYNIGLNYNQQQPSLFNELECSIDGYYNRITDKITIVYGMPFSTVRNIGLVEIKGCDINLKSGKNINKYAKIQLNMSYSFQLTKDKDSTSVTFNNSLPYTPINSGSASLSFQYKKLELGYNLLYAGNRNTGNISTSSSTLKTMNPYADNNLYGKYTLGKCMLMAEVLNVTNTSYSIIDYYPMPCRSYRMTINYKF